MNRRITSLMLCLMMLLALPWAAPAQQPQVDQLFGSRLYEDGNDSILSLVLHEGRALMLTRQSLYSWQPGEQEATKVSTVATNYQEDEEKLPTARALFVRDGQLYGLDDQQGIIWQLQVDAQGLSFSEPQQLDWSQYVVEEGEYSYVNSPQFVLAQGDRLFVKTPNWGGEKAQDLCSYDLNTGAIRHYTPLHYQSLVPYKEGKLIGVYHDQNQHDPVTYQQMDAQLKVFDPETDSDSPLALQPPESGSDRNRSLQLFYQAAEDRVYAANAYGLYRLSDSQPPVLVARLPMAGSWFSGGMTPGIQPLEDGRLLIAFGANAFLRGMDEDQLKPVVGLTLNSSNLSGQALSLSLMAMDDIEILPYRGDWLDNQAMLTLFMTGDMPLDILDLTTNYNDVQRLMQKGYLLDLTDDPTLSQIGQDSFDNLKPVMYDQDRLYLLPISIDSTFVSAYGRYFQEIGREIPQSYPELLAFVRWWAEEGHKEHEGYTLFDQPGAANVLKELAYSLYKDKLFGQGKPLVFDMADFGKLMQDIDAIDFSGFDLRPEDLDEESYGQMPGKTLIMVYMGYSMADSTPDSTTPIDLSLDGKTPAYRLAYVRLLGIPATTKHPEQAKRLLANYLSMRPAEDRAATSQAWDQPIENRYYDRQVEDAQRALKHLQRMRDQAPEGAQKRQFALDVERVEQQLANAEQLWRYRISLEALKRHKELMSRLYADDSLSLVANEALSKDGYLFSMYTQGAISLEQFIQQANDKIRLMTLEAK